MYKITNIGTSCNLKTYFCLYIYISHANLCKFVHYRTATNINLDNHEELDQSNDEDSVFCDGSSSSLGSRMLILNII